MTRLWPPPLGGRRGRQLARVELLVAGLLVFVLEPFVFTASPGTSGPMFGRPSPIETFGIPAAGFLAQLAAIAVMVRIYRADPEGGERTWRYHIG